MKTNFVKIINNTIPLLIALCISSCSAPSEFEHSEELPPIYPDYVGVTVPSTMAPLTFEMADGRRFSEVRTNMGDSIMVTVKAWNKGAHKGVEYKTFFIYLSHDHIDPYIVYRLIEPGYESWKDMGIYQRELASYKETAIVTNEATGKGCMNCHTFAGGDPSRMLLHLRGVGGGTAFLDGTSSTLVNIAGVGPKRQGVYPAWHPDGRYVVFSSNSTLQCFHFNGDQPLEVFDTDSDLIIADLQTMTFDMLIETQDAMETFPAWSADGKTIYYCRADAVDELPRDRGQVHYSLMAADFTEDHLVGEPRTIFSRDDISASFPRVSGDWLLFTASSFGTFPIWHKEADLWMLNLSTGEVKPAEELNSGECESYHSWSSEGRWIIFSSRRDDGRFTRLYIAHYEGNGRFGKPFMLPQAHLSKDRIRLKSYNVPEFVSGEVPSRQKQIKALFK